MILLSMIMALVGGQSLVAILGGFTAVQWVSLASTLLGAEPDVLKAFLALHPVLASLAGAFEQRLKAQEIANLAITNFEQWAAANPGVDYYKPDGSVGVTGRS
jgi:hypothetical protein